MVDQSMLARTPRSTPILYLGLYDRVRELFAAQPEAMAQGLTASAFSFNSGSGRCERCCGTGFEKIEMQFLSDLYVRCAECEGRRFQPHVLRVQLHGKSIHDVLQLTVSEAIKFFAAIGESEKLGPPLSAGGSRARLSAARSTAQHSFRRRIAAAQTRPASWRTRVPAAKQNGSARGNLLIFDEPTTGLHFDDVAMLVKLFQRLVEAGNTIVVIEHNLEVIKCADWVIDLGPEAGDEGGKLVAAGTPEAVARVAESHTGRFLQISHLERRPRDPVAAARDGLAARSSTPLRYAWDDDENVCACGRRASDARFRLASASRNHAIRIHGAREHNLKNISLDIPRDKMVIITGLSGSGKSTVAFDILFAEGQRRFLDSMSPYARQFVEQLEKPDVDLVEGVPPSVAIEQRVTRGGGKSTVATVTEVYHFLRLLFAKDRNAVLSRLRFAGRETKSRRDRETTGDGRETRTAQGSGSAGESAQRISHRCRALGGAAGLRHALRRWRTDADRAIPKARAFQGTHHRRRGRSDRCEANSESAESGPARARYRTRHRASARREDIASRS